MNTACPTPLDPETRQRIKPWALLGLASFPAAFLITIALFAAQVYGGMPASLLVAGLLVTFAIRRLVTLVAVRQIQAVAGEAREPWTYTLVLVLLILVCAIVFGSKGTFW